jgi:hypothetical protein
MTSRKQPQVPPARMLMFPLTRRVTLIARVAYSMANAQNLGAAEGIMTAIISRQRKAMTRKGIAPFIVERECRALEAAIRARLLRLVLTPNDAA